MSPLFPASCRRVVSRFLPLPPRILGRRMKEGEPPGLRRAGCVVPVASTPLLSIRRGDLTRSLGSRTDAPSSIRTALPAPAPLPPADILAGAPG